MTAPLRKCSFNFFLNFNLKKKEKTSHQAGNLGLIPTPTPRAKVKISPEIY